MTSQTEQSRQPPRRQVALAIATAASAASGLWVLGVLLTAGYGLDLTDESFYLLSYRWWYETPRVFTGAQYLYGPVYQMVGYDVEALRLFRLATVLGAHLWLGAAAARWSRATRPSPITKTQEWAIVALVVAAGGITYAWLPLSPGYNDVSLLGTVVLAGGFLICVTASSAGKPLPAWVGALCGPVIGAMLLTKWASAVVVLAGLGTAGTLVLVLLRSSGWLRFIATTLGASALSAFLFHLLVSPIDQIVAQMRDVTAYLMSQTNNPAGLIALYVDTAMRVVRDSLPAVALGLATLGIATALSSRWPQAAALGCLTPLATAALCIRDNGMPHGGSANVTGYVTLLVALCLTAGVGLVVNRVTLGQNPTPAQRLDLPVSTATALTVVLLICLAPAHGFGTGNVLYYIAANGFALWMVPLARVTVGHLNRFTAHTAALAASTVLMAATSGWVAYDGLLHHPYRVDPRAKATSTVSSQSTGTVHVSPTTARQTRALQAALRSETSTPGTAIMAFDRSAGLVLMLNGRSVGEAWYSAYDQPRTAAGIRATCADAHWFGHRDGPVVLLLRPLTADDRAAIATCGFIFPSDFKEVRIPGGPPGVTAYVPSKKLTNR